MIALRKDPLVKFEMAAADKSRFTFQADALAVSPASNHLLLCSVAGRQQEIKTLAAILQTKVHAKFRWKHNILDRSPDGYTCHKARLGYDTWHLLAVARTPGLLIDASDESLWRILRSEQYTTPLLRSWVPDIGIALRRFEWLNDCDRHGCAAAVLSVSPKDLDELVSRGVVEGWLAMK